MGYPNQRPWQNRRPEQPRVTRITKISAHSSTKFADPHERWTSHQISISLDATLGDDDDPDTVARELQARAQRLLDEHKAELLKALRAAKDTGRGSLEDEARELTPFPHHCEA